MIIPLAILCSHLRISKKKNNRGGWLVGWLIDKEPSPKKRATRLQIHSINKGGEVSFHPHARGYKHLLTLLRVR